MRRAWCAARYSSIVLNEPGVKNAYTLIFSLLLFVIFHCFTITIQQKLAIDSKAFWSQKNIYGGLKYCFDVRSACRPILRDGFCFFAVIIIIAFHAVLKSLICYRPYFSFLTAFHPLSLLLFPLLHFQHLSCVTCRVVCWITFDFESNRLVGSLAAFASLVSCDAICTPFMPGVKLYTLWRGDAGSVDVFDVFAQHSQSQCWIETVFQMFYLWSIKMSYTLTLLAYVRILL